MKVPDFFIVGAPKSGTTALYTYLSEHPSVFMPARKEPAYFSSDFSGYRAIRDSDAYEALFEAGLGKLTGEASTNYLVSSVAIRRIMDARPDAKIIVMLRNPLTATRAFHRQMLLALKENVADFEVAWRLQDERAAGRSIPSLCRDVKFLLYGKLYTYAPQIQRVIQLVPATQRHFIIYEEFSRDPRRHYEEVLSFLGLDHDGRKHYPIVNSAKKLRSRMLERTIVHPPDGMVRGWHVMRRVLGLNNFHPMLMMEKYNRVPVVDTKISSAMKAELMSYFEQDIKATEDLLERDLSLWRDFGRAESD